MTKLVQSVIAKMGQPLIWKMYKWYMARPRWYNYRGIRVRLLPTVFHPGWLISTKVLLEFLAKMDLVDKHFIELGAGSGLIALHAASMGANVMATDINPHAIHALEESSLKNNIRLQVIQSDLFENIPIQIFDYIVINPPYFPREPKDYWELAFYCGEKFEYFHRLFNQIYQYINPPTSIYMILNEFCAVDTIKGIARQWRIELGLVHQETSCGEDQYIFRMFKIESNSGENAKTDNLEDS